MASQQEEYVEQLRQLQERWPQIAENKIVNLLKRHNGDANEVHVHLFHQDSRMKRADKLETRYGAALTAFQQAHPTSQTASRLYLLKTLANFGGDFGFLEKCLEKNGIEQSDNIDDTPVSRLQHREDLKSKYAVQLAELTNAGINVNCPCVLAKLEKHRGDLKKVMDFMKRQEQKKSEVNSMTSKYATQLEQLEADGVKTKNKRLLIQLLEKANGDVDVVKKLLAEQQQQHQVKSTNHISTTDQHDIDIDDLDHLKELRSAGVHGNPVKILKVFHECNDSIEETIVRLAKEREHRAQQSAKRTEERVILAEIQDAYLTINNLDDWPQNIEQVYLDGNNMIFVVDSLRRLCLNRNGKKTERAIAEIAATWNEHMHIPNVDLVFDSTRQLDSVGSVRVSSAQPQYRTTDDMLIDIARRSENQRTIIVTSDRDLSIRLKHEGCMIVKSYQWFAHCVMVLAPDLMKSDDTSTMKKIRYDLDELVHRIAKIDL